MKRKIFSKLLMGALLVASVSSFVSCKDYDDDIQQNTTAIETLRTQVSTLETALAQAKSEATAAHALYALKTDLAAKADQSSLNDVKNSLDASIVALQTEVKALVTASQLTEAIDAAKATLQVALDGKASQLDLNDLSLKVSAIDPKLDQINTALGEVKTASEAAANNIATQQLAIEALQTGLKAAQDAQISMADVEAAIKKALGESTETPASAADVTALKADFETLKTTVAAAATAAAVEEVAAKVTALEATKTELASLKTTVESYSSQISDVKTAMTEASAAVDKVAAELNLLTVFINKRLTSLVLDPQFYWGGIEAVEAPRLTYWPLGYTTPYDEKRKNGDQVAYTYLNSIDAVTYPRAYEIYLPIEADYFMNPSTANTDDFTSVEVISYDKATYTRSSESKPVVVDYFSAHGILTTKVALDYDKIATVQELTFNSTTSGWKWNGDVLEYISSQANSSTVNTQEGLVTVLAVQAHLKNEKGEKSDTTVTSDFAAVAPSTIANFRIVDNSPYLLNVWDNCDIPNETSKFHVYTSANNAVARAFTHKLIWNDADGINLDDIVEVHASRILATSGASQGEFKLDEDLKKRYGLELKYELLEYLSGVNATAQSKPHATLENGVIKATGINGVQTKASIGREPLVKIELIDTNNDNAIVAIGYIKFQIAAEQPNDVTLEAYTGNAYLLCGGTTFTLKWDQVERDILANNTIRENGMAKATFENIYSLSPRSARLADYSGDISGQSYVRGADNAWVPVSNTWQSYLNNVIHYKSFANDAQAQQTNVVTLDFTTDQVYQILAYRDKDNDMIDEDGNKVTVPAQAKLYDEREIEVAGRFYDISNSGYPDIYIPFKLKISKLHLTLNKIPQYWYDTNNVKAGTGEAEFHINVDAAGQVGAQISHFQGDLLANLYGNELQLPTTCNPATEQFDEIGYSKGYKPADGYKIGAVDRNTIVSDGGLKTDLSFKNGSVEYRFNPTTAIYGTVTNSASGKKYFVYPSTSKMLSAYLWDEENKTIVGTAQDIVEIIYSSDPNTETVFQVKENDFTYDLVNNAPHTDLANSLTATVGVTVKEGDCQVPVILTNSVFNVKFLRPLTPTGKNGSFTDAKTGGNYLFLYNLLTFKDWREEWKNSSPDFYKYYDVTNIWADINNITTDLGGGTLGTTLLSSINQNVKFEVHYPDEDGYSVPSFAGTEPQTNDAPKRKYGYIMYNNNNLTVGKFTIRVPLIVGYYWGKTQDYGIRTYVDITVDYTTQNGAASRAK